MNLNHLYLRAIQSESDTETELFENLYARFTLIARNRILDEQDAEDVIQDSLIQIKKKLGQIEPESKFTSWALKVLKYNIIDYYRKKGRRTERLNTLLLESGTEPVQNSDIKIIRILRNCLKELGQANIRYARILNFIYQGYEFDYICERLALTRSNAYSILSRARSMLMLCIDKGVID